MGRTIIRVRFLLPSSDGVRAVAISLIAHLIVITTVLAFESRSGGVQPPRPIMTVSLVAATPPAAARAIETTVETAQKKNLPEAAKAKPKAQNEAPEKIVKAPAKAKRRAVDQPTEVLARPEGMTAQPENPPVAEPPPPEPQPDAAPSSPTAAGDTPEPAETGVAGMQVVESAEPFQANWWFTSAHSRIERAWRNKPILPRGSPSQRARVVFVVHKSGTITDVEIVDRSGYAPLDLSVHRAMSSIGKLPPLPPAYRGRTLTLTVTFELTAK